MRATLLAAALLLPTLALAGEPAFQAETRALMSPSQVLNKLHHASQKGLEKATMAQTSSTDARVKAFAAQQEKDYQKLDASVVELARTKELSLDPPAVTMRAEGTKAAARSEQQKGSMDRMSPDSPTIQLGTAGDTRTSTSAVGTTEDSLIASAGEMDANAARMERLRGLKGSAFDTEYLAMAVEGAQDKISMLESARAKSDVALTRVVDQAIAIYRAHQKQAEKLQRTLRAS